MDWSQILHNLLKQPCLTLWHCNLLPYFVYELQEHMDGGRSALRRFSVFFWHLVYFLPPTASMYCSLRISKAYFPLYDHFLHFKKFHYFFFQTCLYCFLAIRVSNHYHFFIIASELSRVSIMLSSCWALVQMFVWGGAREVAYNYFLCFPNMVLKLCVYCYYFCFSFMILYLYHLHFAVDHYHYSSTPFYFFFFLCVCTCHLSPNKTTDLPCPKPRTPYTPRYMSALVLL